MRESSAGERDDLGGVCGGPGIERDEGLRPLTPLLVRHADHGTIQMSQDRLLDLEARDVLTAGDDDVLPPVAELDVGIRVLHGKTAQLTG